MIGFFKSIVRICSVMYFRLNQDLAFIRASALTFNTLLALVPIVAVMFGIAEGFGIQEVLKSTLESEFSDQKEVIEHLIQFGYSLLEQTRSGLIAGIGIITLFYTVLMLLSTVEDSLNVMWGIKGGRPLSRKIIDFLALILIGPVFLVISSSLAVYINTNVQSFESTPWISEIQPYMLKLLSYVSYVICIFLFTFLYIFMPNANVKKSSALLAGVCAGIAFQFLQTSYIYIQIHVSKAGAIYGSFAALPLFLIWMYVSWMIFLIGAEIVVIHQERLWDHKIAAPYRTLTPYEKKLAYLAIVQATVQAYEKNMPPITSEILSTTLRMPVRLITELIENLVSHGILINTLSEDQKPAGVVPARDPDNLRISDVLYAIEGGYRAENEIELPQLKAFEKILNPGSIYQLSQGNEQDLRFKDMVIPQT